MAEQVLKKTRIQLRRATTAEWETYKDVVPTAGEPCFDLELNTLKIGDGTHKYSELDFVYAKAADVVAACKSEYALTTFVNNIISNAGIATNEALTTLAGRVTTAEGEIDALQGLVGETAVPTQIQNAITNLDLANTYEAKGAAATVKTELVGTDSDTAASATIAGAKKYADSLDAAMDTRVDALEAAIGEGGSVAAQITAEIQKLDKEDTAVAHQVVTAVSETDGKIAVTRAQLTTDDIAAGTEVWIFDCGDSTTI